MSEADKAFVGDQKVFFIASASDAEVNLSPKGYDALRIVDDKTLVYLDYPGSGDRTARDIRNGGKITIMFTAFEGKPLILRLFAKGELVEKDHADFADLFSLFGDVDPASIRRLIRFRVEVVERSCGMGTPLMSFDRERENLRDWAVRKGGDGTLPRYIADHATPVDLSKVK